MAERARFELALGLLLNNISNVAPSTARPSLRIFQRIRPYYTPELLVVISNWKKRRKSGFLKTSKAVFLPGVRQCW